MALYTYEAFSKDGKRVHGTLDAPSLASIKEQLVRQGLFPIKIEPAQLESSSFFGRFFTKKVSTKEKILFTKQLSVLLQSGIPLLQAIELLVEQFTGQLHSMLVSIKDDLKQGSSLANAMSKYPRTFETIYIQLVRAGEASGQLETILERLTHYLERREALAKKVSGALRYPLIQLGVILSIVALMLVFIVPRMAEIFSSQGKALPAPTQLLIALSDFMTGHFLLIVSGVTGIAISYSYWASTPRGARTIDEIKLRLPLVKFLSKTNAVVQFSYTLGMLLEGGVHLSEALDIVVKIIDNRVLADALSVARDKIVKQGKIAQYLKQTGIFPPIAIYLIETGEQTGQLDTMLLSVARTYEEEVSELTNNLTSTLQPVMSIGMALIVGFIVIALALPVMQMGELAGI